MSRVPFAGSSVCRERRPARSEIPRHRHEQAYAALVVGGSFEEAGDCGRWIVEAGSILIHSRFEAHLDRFGSRGAEIVNVPLPGASDMAPGVWKVDDPDSIVGFAADAGPEIWPLLRTQLRCAAPRLGDWPDLLADDLAVDPNLSLRAWASRTGLSPSAVSRGFRKVYGTSPKAFRAEARARRAWLQIECSAARLAEIAAETGFADQAHMTRGVSAVTGKTPGAWRRPGN